MSPVPAAPPIPWPAAAESLALRVTRRARAGAFLPRLAAGMAIGAGIAVLSKAWGASFPGALVGAIAFPTAAGLLLGLRAARRVRPTTPGDAAWALDRLAHASERGLTAAVATGPAAAEAAWSSPAVVAPAVRLKPPAGLVATLSAALLVVVASLWPERADAGAPARPGASVRRAGAAATAALEAARAETSAREAERAAAAERALRESLGLPPNVRPDAAHLLPRLRTPEDLAAARRAAPPGSDLEKAFASGDPAKAAAAAADVLGAGAVDRATDLRREAAQSRAAAGVVPVPPARRALVERWFAARYAAAPKLEGAGR